MVLLQKLRDLDTVTKVGLVVILMMFLYIVFLFLLKPVFIASETASHSSQMGDHMMTFTSPDQRNLNLAAIFISLLIGSGIWLVIRPNKIHAEKPQEIEILKRALSPDEKKLLEEIQRAGEITQDSLRFRLNWSKAKVSAILLQLDRMSLVQRERQGKTYNVRIQQKEKVR